MVGRQTSSSSTTTPSWTCGSGRSRIAVGGHRILRPSRRLIDVLELCVAGSARGVFEANSAGGCPGVELQGPDRTGAHSVDARERAHAGMPRTLTAMPRSCERSPRPRSSMGSRSVAGSRPGSCSPAPPSPPASCPPAPPWSSLRPSPHPRSKPQAPRSPPACPAAAGTASRPPRPPPWAEAFTLSGPTQWLTTHWRVRRRRPIDGPSNQWDALHRSSRAKARTPAR